MAARRGGGPGPVKGGRPVKIPVRTPIKSPAPRPVKLPVRAPIKSPANPIGRPGGPDTRRRSPDGRFA